MNSDSKIYPMNEFQAIFSISSILVIRSGYAKKDHFSILAVIQIYGIYINLGCRFEFTTQKLPYERISGNFSDFHQFWSSFLNISCISKCMGFTINMGCRFEFRTQKLPYERIRAIFPISSILVIRSGYAKKDHFSILPVILNIWDLHKFGLQICIQNAKITLWKNFGQFFQFHRFWSSVRVCEKSQFSILAVFQNVCYLHKIGLQIWIHDAKITPWKNFGQFFFFHQFWSSCEKR